MTEPARTLYPPIEPFKTGTLDTGEGHTLYWELCGNPQGKPAVFRAHQEPGRALDPIAAFGGRDDFHVVPDRVRGFMAPIRVRPFGRFP